MDKQSFESDLHKVYDAILKSERHVQQANKIIDQTFMDDITGVLADTLLQLVQERYKVDEDTLYDICYSQSFACKKLTKPLIKRIWETRNG